jgi:radical SAM superfamily enzyme YgiQ (UPF0313 family)
VKPKILLVNPPIYDFSAYDFWMKPMGLLRAAGPLRHQADMRLFDYMDRLHSSLKNDKEFASDAWGRGKFPSAVISKPLPLVQIPRRFNRLGLKRELFQNFLKNEGPFDFVMVQTVMTYWYLGIQEVIEDIRKFSPNARIILGGVYATLCPGHARSLGADFIVEGLDLNPLWEFLNLEPHMDELPLWEAYTELNTGVLKLAQGCPFKCSYCSVPQVYPQFHGYPLERSMQELQFLCRLGAKNIVFYDDALLYQSGKILIPFLESVLKKEILINFHTPNALNARFITKDLAELMVRAGFKTFYLGFESSAYEWQKKTGGKIYSDEFARAIDNLYEAGANLEDVTAYLIVAHPQGELQNVEDSMRFANSLGIRVMLSDFSPIPGTPDGEACRSWVDLEEPLMHNKTAFPIIFLGEGEVNRLKQICRELNGKISTHERHQSVVI